MKKLLTLLPIIGLILGTVAIAGQARTLTFQPTGQQLSGVVVICIHAAVEQKETTLMTALQTYQSGSLSVLFTRKTSLLAAWENPTKQSIKAAITQTLKQYKNSMSLLSADLRTARKTAWSVYKQQVKTCGGTSLVQRVDTSSVTLEQ